MGFKITDTTIQLGVRADDPAENPPAGHCFVYLKAGIMYIMDDEGNVATPGGVLADNSVALAKLINATAQYNLIGRSSAGSGAWEEKATSADVFAMLGAANNAAIRTAIGLEIGNNVQAYSSVLATLSGSSANGQSLVTAADYAAMKALLNLEIGTDVQAYDADLTTWAGKTAPTGTVLGTTDTQTLTNKRITKRSVTVTVAAEPAINTDNGDIFRIGVSGDLIDLAITSLTTNLTGTPTHGQMIVIEFLDDGTARAIAHGSSFRAGVNHGLLTTTVLSKLSRETFMWDSADSKWDLVGKWTEV